MASIPADLLAQIRIPSYRRDTLQAGHPSFHLNVSPWLLYVEFHPVDQGRLVGLRISKKQVQVLEN